MDTERVPTTLRRPEVTSPVHDPTNLGPSLALSSTSSEKLDVHDTSSLQPLRSNSDRLVQPLQSSVAFLEPNSEEREFKTKDDDKFQNEHNEIDWIVPKETKVSNAFYLLYESR